MNKLTLIILSFIFTQCQGQKDSHTETAKEKELRQDALIEKYVHNCANKFNYNYQMQEWQNCLDEGIKIDSTVAYFWQQKAMPYFKARKYEVGMAYLDKAVFYKPERWLSYRAFIKCIFSKQYKEALKDFELCVEMEGYSYVQDHTPQRSCRESHRQWSRVGGTAGSGEAGCPFLGRPLARRQQHGPGATV